MKTRVSEKATKLNTTSSLFSPEQFVLRALSGEQSPFLEATEKHCIHKSVQYTVFDKDLEPIHEIKMYKDKGNAILHYLPQDCFILNERGTVGFDFEMKLFNCRTQITEDELIVDINEVPEKLSELEDYIDENLVLLRDRFNEGMINAVLDQIRKTDYRYELAVQNTLADIEKTKFLEVTQETDMGFCLIEDQAVSDGFSYANRKVKVRRASGFFSSLVKDENVWEQELLMIKDKNEKNTFTVEKPIERMHDIKGRFWLKSQVLFRYPQDKQQLSKELPMLYSQVTEKIEKWREIEQLTEEPNAIKLGDLDIMMPCAYLKKTNWFMDNDVFHFTIKDEKGFTPNIGLTRGKIMCADYAASVVNYKNRDYFAVFKSKGKKRFGKNVFAHYVFHKLVPASDTVAELDSTSIPKLYPTLFLKYQFQLHRNKIKPHIITEEVFNIFELANDLSKEEKHTCVLEDVFDFTRTHD